MKSVQHETSRQSAMNMVARSPLPVVTAGSSFLLGRGKGGSTNPNYSGHAPNFEALPARNNNKPPAPVFYLCSLEYTNNIAGEKKALGLARESQDTLH